MKYGMFFKRLTGKDPSKFASIIEIEQAVEEHTGKPLLVRTYPSNLISSRDSVFPFSSTQSSDIDRSFFDL